MIIPTRLYPLSGRRVYRLRGQDVRDLLQRISTADVSPLADGRAVATLLTNEKGRVVDLACVQPEGNGSYLLAGVGDDDGRIAAWLDRFIIMEDVHVADVSDTIASSVVYAEDTEGRWILPEDIPGAVVPVTMGRHRWGLAIDARGTTRSLMQIVDEATFTRDRVVAGVPWCAYEITERRHPLEARLRSLISFTKGCYIGQEVVARLDAYRKVQMALTRFEGTLKPSEASPIPLHANDGVEAGLLTTIAPDGPRTSALGFMRIEALKTKTPVVTPGGAVMTPVDTDTEKDIYYSPTAT